MGHCIFMLPFMLPFIPMFMPIGQLAPWVADGVADCLAAVESSDNACAANTTSTTNPTKLSDPAIFMFMTIPFHPALQGLERL